MPLFEKPSFEKLSCISKHQSLNGSINGEEPRRNSFPRKYQVDMEEEKKEESQEKPSPV